MGSQHRIGCRAWLYVVQRCASSRDDTVMRTSTIRDDVLSESAEWGGTEILRLSETLTLYSRCLYDSCTKLQVSLGAQVGACNIDLHPLWGVVA